MDIEVTDHEGILVVSPKIGDFDATVTTAFKGKVVDLINKGTRNFVMNLSHINFIDSSGLGIFVSIKTLIETNHGNIVFCSVSVPVLALFKIARLNQIFMILSDEKKSIAYLKTKSA